MPHDGKTYEERRRDELAGVQASVDRLPVGEGYVLELGCGHGHYLAALAHKERAEGVHQYYVGVDKNPERIALAQRKSQRAGLDNISWINARVADVLERWPERCQIREVFILFPDPWPKARHQKHRFVKKELLEQLAKLMPMDGRLYFRSDNREYFAEVDALVGHNVAWDLVQDSSEMEALWPQGMPATVFEGHHPVYQSLVAVRR